MQKSTSHNSKSSRVAKNTKVMIERPRESAGSIIEEIIKLLVVDRGSVTTVKIPLKMTEIRKGGEDIPAMTAKIVAGEERIGVREKTKDEEEWGVAITEEDQEGEVIVRTVIRRRTTTANGSEGRKLRLKRLSKRLKDEPRKPRGTTVLCS